MLALLEDAIRCFQRHAFDRSRRGRRLFAEAEQWLLGGGPPTCFSFETVCAFLELDPGYVRRGVLEWRDRERRVDVDGAPPRSSSGAAARAGRLRRRVSVGGKTSWSMTVRRDRRR